MPCLTTATRTTTEITQTGCSTKNLFRSINKSVPPTGHMHKLFCVFGDFYLSGTQDSEVTKSLIGSLEFFFANGHSLDACLCFVVVEQEKSIVKCLLVYVENQTNIAKQNLFQWEKLGHCEQVRWAYLPVWITSQYAGLATSCPVTEPFIVIRNHKVRHSAVTKKN